MVLESLFNKVAGLEASKYCEIFKNSFFVENHVGCFWLTEGYK